MMRRSRQEMIDETRAKLVEAARRVFVRDGYAETAMEDLTSAAGLTRGALYHHFGGKKGLLEAVARAIEVEMDERLQSASDAGVDVFDGLVRRCHLYLEMALEEEIQRIVFRDAPAILGPGYIESCQRSCLASLSSMLSALMKEGTLHSGDPVMIARLINGGLVHAALWISSEGDPRPRLANATENIDLLLSGLRK